MAQPYPQQQYAAEPYPQQQYYAEPPEGNQYTYYPPQQANDGYAAVPQNGPPPPAGFVVVAHPSPHGQARYRADSEDVEYARPSNPMGSSFDDKAVRRAFIRKVFMLVAIMLLITTSIGAFIQFHEPTRLWVVKYWFVGLLAMVVMIAAYCTLVCCQSVARKTPWNYILLFTVTFLMSYWVGWIAARYTLLSVVLSFGITSCSVFAISLVAICLPIDFTRCFMIMIGITFAFFFAGIALFIIQTFFTGRIPLLHIIFSGIGAAIFMVWLAIDIQMVIGGKRMEMSPEDYVLGALHIYYDICMIFVYILAIFGGQR